MGLTTKRVQVIDEVNYGVYLWKVPDKGFVSDGEGNYWMIKANRGDKKAIQLLKDSVKSEFGIDTGKAVFFAGHRPVDEEEFERQKTRSALGLIPDEQDMPANLDRLKHARTFGE